MIVGVSAVNNHALGIMLIFLVQISFLNFCALETPSVPLQALLLRADTGSCPVVAGGSEGRDGERTWVLESS